MISLLKKYFDVVENEGDNYNDITVLLFSCWCMNELAETWERLKSKGKFDKLSKYELMQVVRLKNRLKLKFINVSLKQSL